MSNGKKDNSIHIQARLHRQKVREADACVVYDELKRRGLTEREMVREALIAYGQMTDSGWQPQLDVTEVRMTNEMITMFRNLQTLTTRLASMTFAIGSNQQAEMDGLQRELTEFEESAKGLLGDAIFFDEA